MPSIKSNADRWRLVENNRDVWKGIRLRTRWEVPISFLYQLFRLNLELFIFVKKIFSSDHPEFTLTNEKYCRHAVTSGVLPQIAVVVGLCAEVVPRIILVQLCIPP